MEHPQKRILVRGLSNGTTPDDLQEIFARYGVLKQIWIPENTQGFAFIHYKRRKQAVEAVSKLNGIVVKDSKWTLNFSVRKCNPKGLIFIDKIANKPELADLIYELGKIGEVKAVSVDCRNLNDHIIVEYDDKEVAKAELDKWNGYDFCGMKLKAIETNKVLRDVTKRSPALFRLNVKGLPADTTAADLRQAFGAYGRVIRATVPPRSEGAYVDFTSEENAEDALEEMDGRPWHGTRLIVDAVDQKRLLQQRRPRKRVYLLNIADETSMEDLMDTFEKIGELSGAYIPKMSSGYAWVEFKNLWDAEKAMRVVNETDVNGRCVLMEYAKRDLHEPTTRVTRNWNTRKNNSYRRQRGRGRGGRFNSGGGHRRGDDEYDSEEAEFYFEDFLSKTGLIVNTNHRCF